MADYNYIDKGLSDGTVLGQKTTSKIGFFGITPVDQPAALTTALTTITYTTASAVATTITKIAASGFGFVSSDEAQSFLAVVSNLQTRIGEISSRLAEAGVIAGGTAIADASLKDYDVIGFGTDEGSIFGGTSSEKIGFWGIAPCDQPAALTAQGTTIVLTAVTATAADYTIATMITSVTAFGFVTLEDAASVMYRVANMQTRVGQLETNLAEVGLIAGGTALTTTTSYDYLDKGSDDGTILGRSSSVKIGFWGTTPAVQQNALTTASTTVTVTAPGTADYAIADLLVTAGTYRFVSVTAGYCLLETVQSCQTRLAELETRLETLGLIASN